jgi:hypothetical protein
VAAAGATVASVWVIHNVKWPGIHLPHFGDVKVVRSQERSESFEDWEDRQARERGQLRGELRDADELGKGEEAHHIVAVRHRYAKYAREVMWKCGIDLKDLDNGVGMKRRYHRRVHTKAYFAAVDRMLTAFDPDKGGSCLNDPDDAFGPGIRGALRKIAKWIAEGKFNG